MQVSEESQAKAAGSRRRDQPHALHTTIALAVLNVALFVLALPPVYIWPLALLAPIPLVLLASRSRSTRRAIIVVFVIQTIQWLWIQRWIIPVSAWGYPFLALYLSLYPSFFVWVISRVAKHPKLSRLPWSITLPVLWVGIEFLRSEIVFHGYPWYLLAHPLAEIPLAIQSTDLLGTYFISFLVAMIAGLVIDIFSSNHGDCQRRCKWWIVSAATVIIMANVGYGVWRINQKNCLRPGPTLLAIQTNLPQSNKIAWSMEQQRKDATRFFTNTYTIFNETNQIADLIIWPETMLPGLGLDQETLDTLRQHKQQMNLSIAQGAIHLGEVMDRPLLVGAACFLGLHLVTDENNENPRWDWTKNYNSAYLITGSQPYQRYDKCFLTPFGETMPYISAWPWLEQQFLAIGAGGMTFDLDQGTEPKVIEVPWSEGSFTLATPICYEDTVAELCRKSAYHNGRKRIDAFVNLSNDGWFGDYDTARAQHTQIARFRCVENRVPMMRVVNTGLSSAIDSVGRIIGTIGEGRYGQARQSGYLLSSLPLDSRQTLYARLGDFWGWLCMALTALVMVRSFLGTR